MQRNAVQENQDSSFPLVDFISKWRLRGQTAPELPQNTAEPLLAGQIQQENHEVPYPLPDSFLQKSKSFEQSALEDYEEAAEADSEDDAQSIKSYGSDHIRFLDSIGHFCGPFWIHLAFVVSNL